MTDLNVIFLKRSLKFTKSQKNFGSNLKKTANKTKFFKLLHLKIDFRKIFSKFEIGMVLIDLNQNFPMKPSEFEISLSVESYEKKPDKNCRNGNVVEKRIISKL